MTVLHKHIIRPRLAALVATLATICMIPLATTVSAEASQAINSLGVSAVVSKTAAAPCGGSWNAEPGKRLSRSGKGGTINVRWAQTCTHADLNVYVRVGSSTIDHYRGTVPDGARVTLDFPDQSWTSNRHYTVIGESGDDRITLWEGWSRRQGATGFENKPNLKTRADKPLFARVNAIGLAEGTKFSTSRARIDIANTSGVIGSDPNYTNEFEAVYTEFRKVWGGATVLKREDGGESVVMVFTDKPVTNVKFIIGRQN